MPNYGQGAQGAAGGALAGGSIGGPIGAVAGGIIGGGMGLFGGGGGPSAEEKMQQKMMMEYWNRVNNRGVPQAGAAAQSGYSGFRQNQSDLIERLEALSQGKGPSLAMEQMKAGMDRSQSAQASMANSGRGGPMMAMQAAGNMGRLQAQGTQDAASARIAEQQMALSQLGMTLHSARGADEQTNMFNANENNQQSLANLDARLRSMGMDDQARLGILQAMGQWNANQTNKSAQPGTGEQILAGGAGMFAAGLGRNAGIGGGAPGTPKFGAGWGGNGGLGGGAGGFGVSNSGTPWYK